MSPWSIRFAGNNTNFLGTGAGIAPVLVEVELLIAFFMDYLGKGITYAIE
ncbi:hypothetical protein J27TS7_04700 [Paenibacillus dendritiformis]|nr:hypothetical protein J27TS7_04700 [Paenibacillus dendritiformis]